MLEKACNLDAEFGLGLEGSADEASKVVFTANRALGFRV